MSELEVVDVTVKVPKAILELFEAFRKLNKGLGPSIESWLWDRMIFGLKDELKDLNLDDTFGVNGDRLIEAYGLDRVFQYYHKDPKPKDC